MDSTFDNFDFQTQTLPQEIEIKFNSDQRPRYNQRAKPKPATSLATDIWICGSKDKTIKRDKELEALGDKDGVVHIEMLSNDNLAMQVARLKDKMVDLLNGHAQLPIGDNRQHKKCHFKLACEKGFDGEHGFGHPTANWIIWEMFRNLYRSVKRSQTQPSMAAAAEAADDAWDVQDDSQGEKGFYRHQHPDSLPFMVEVAPRTNTADDKLARLFTVTLVDFFAGRKGLTRIGALKASKERPARWCKGPFCYRTLMAGSSKDAATACKSFHSDEVSFLTSLARALVECRKLPKTVTLPIEITPTKSIKPRQIQAPKKQPTIVTNAFAALRMDVDDQDDEI